MPACAIRLLQIRAYSQLAWSSQSLSTCVPPAVVCAGPRWGWVILPFQVVYLWGISILYTVTGASALEHVYKAWGGTTIDLSIWIVVYAGIQIFVSQVRGVVWSAPGVLKDKWGNSVIGPTSENWVLPQY